MFVTPQDIFFTLRNQQDYFVDRIRMEEVKMSFVKKSTQDPEKILKEEEKRLPFLQRQFSRLRTKSSLSTSPVQEDTFLKEAAEIISLTPYHHSEFQIETIEKGENLGRTYHIRVAQKDDCNKVVDKLSRFAEKAKVIAEKKANLGGHST